MTLLNASGRGYLLGAGIPLGTRKGTQIENERRSQRAPESMEAARKFVVENHGTAKMRSLSSMYNCMGMVFAARRTLVDPDQLPLILREDGYRRLRSLDEAMQGDLVVYRDDQGMYSHVAVITYMEIILPDRPRVIMVMSQWGADGEYTHAVSDVNPVYGDPTEYWTDRT